MNIRTLRQGLSENRDAFIAGAVLALFLFPIYWFYITGLKGQAELDAYPPTLWPHEPTANFLRVMRAVPVASYLSNSLLIALGTSLLTMTIGVGASWSLVRFRSRWVDMLILVIIILQMLPAALMATPLYVIFSNLGLLDTRLSVVLAASAKTIPFVIVLLRPSFIKIPKDLIEAASMDRCTGWRLLYYVAFPLVRNAALVTFVLVFMQSYGEFIFSRSFLQSSDKLPATVGLVVQFFGTFTKDISGAMAFGAIYLTPILAVFVVVQRHLISGLTAGAVK